MTAYRWRDRERELCLCVCVGVGLEEREREGDHPNFIRTKMIFGMKFRCFKVQTCKQIFPSQKPDTLPAPSSPTSTPPHPPCVFLLGLWTSSTTFCLTLEGSAAWEHHGLSRHGVSAPSTDAPSLGHPIFPSFLLGLLLIILCSLHYHLSSLMRAQ